MVSHTSSIHKWCSLLFIEQLYDYLLFQPFNEDFCTNSSGRWHHLTSLRTCTFRHLEDLEVVPHPFWHLKDLEVVPHPRGQMLFSMNSSNIKSNGFERQPSKPGFDFCFTIFFHFYPKVQMIPWSIHTFWYNGLVENKEKRQVRKRDYISQK